MIYHWTYTIFNDVNCLIRETSNCIKHAMKWPEYAIGGFQNAGAPARALESLQCHRRQISSPGNGGSHGPPNDLSCEIIHWECIWGHSSKFMVFII